MKRLLPLIGLLVPLSLPAQGDGDIAQLLRQAEQVERDAADLGIALYDLEESLLRPDEGRITVFVSMPFGVPFVLEQVRITLDGRTVATQRYSIDELGMLQDDAVQPILVAHMAPGPHVIQAEFRGADLNGFNYVQATELQFIKRAGARFIHFSIVGERVRHIEARQWE